MCGELFTNRASGGGECGVTATPNPPLSSIPSSPLGTKLREESGHPAAGPGTAPGVAGTEHYSGLELWLYRLTILLFVFLCAVVGVLLMVLPWRQEWAENHLLQGSPRLQAFFASGFVRGLCSGLGLLDIWIGFWEAIRYHEKKRG